MIICKEEFVRVINRLKEADKLQRDVNKLFRNARDNIENDFMNGASLMVCHKDVVLFLLENMFNDKEYANIAWWIYDCEYGAKNTEIYDNKTQEVLENLDTPEKLYDYLIENME